MRGSPWPYPKEVDDIGLGRPLFTCSDRVYRGVVPCREVRTTCVSAPAFS
jgi:hypothetical protein